MLCKASAIIDIHSVFFGGVWGTTLIGCIIWVLRLIHWKRLHFTFKLQRGVVPLIRCGSRGCEWSAFLELIDSQ